MALAGLTRCASPSPPVATRVAWRASSAGIIRRACRARLHEIVRVAAEGRPGTLTLVCLDDRLGAAAEREGFPLVGLDASA